MVYQNFSRISKAIQDGRFTDNTALCSAIDATCDNGGTVHIMGLLSPGGVHSHDDHFMATLRLAALRGAVSITIHGFLDGRDLPAADELQAALPHANRVVVPGAGGFPLWEFPNEVNALVHEHLRQAPHSHR